MRILVTGCRGQLGSVVANELQRRSHEVIRTEHKTMDITNPDAVEEVFSRTTPDAVIHCAAYTNVERAEEERELCRAVNVLGTNHIVEQCRKRKCRLLYVSTDYVFGETEGQGHTVKDAAAPLNVYGRSKYEGEELVKTLERFYIVRTSWLFGENGDNFVSAILKKARRNQPLQVVCDQRGAPTYAGDLSRLLADMIVTDRYGVYHATNEGDCTWYEFAREILRQAGVEGKVIPVYSAAYPAKAKRPSDSRLDKRELDRAGFQRLPAWKESLKKLRLKDMPDK